MPLLEIDKPNHLVFRKMLEDRVGTPTFGDILVTETNRDVDDTDEVVTFNLPMQSVEEVLTAMTLEMSRYYAGCPEHNWLTSAHAQISQYNDMYVRMSDNPRPPQVARHHEPISDTYSEEEYA